MADKKNWLQVLAYVTGSINFSSMGAEMGHSASSGVSQKRTGQILAEPSNRQQIIGMIKVSFWFR